MTEATTRSPGHGNGVRQRYGLAIMGIGQKGTALACVGHAGDNSLTTKRSESRGHKRLLA